MKLTTDVKQFSLFGFYHVILITNLVNINSDLLQIIRQGGGEFKC